MLHPSQVDFKTTHGLPFETAEDPIGMLIPEIKIPGLRRFRVGTVTGQYGFTQNEFYILSVSNSGPGNGHLNDVFEWFEKACRESDRNLLVIEIHNQRFYRHLISKRDFKALDKKNQNVVRVFNPKKYKRLLKHGNEILGKDLLTKGLKVNF